MLMNLNRCVNSFGKDLNVEDHLCKIKKQAQYFIETFPNYEPGLPSFFFPISLHVFTFTDGYSSQRTPSLPEAYTVSTPSPPQCHIRSITTEP